METALSMASLVPDPMEKCAVAAASPISTTLRYDHFSQRTRGKFNQAEPRMCVAFEIRGWPPRYFAKIRSQARQDSSWLIAPKPKFCHVVSEHSTMNVAVSASNW